MKTLFIEPGLPWENGSLESCNGTPWDGLLARPLFDTLLDTNVLIERSRNVYNTTRP